MIDKATLTAWLQKLHLAGNGWFADVLMVLVATALISYVERIVYRRLEAKAEKTKSMWDDVLVKAIHLPLAALIWILGVTFAVDIMQAFLKNEVILDVAHTARDLGLVLCFTWFFLLFVSEGQDKFIERRVDKSELDKHAVYAIAKLARAVIWIIGILAALQTFGIKTSAILALGGLSSAAVVFSAKDLLANFFGGLVIYLDRPFGVGDWVRSPDRNIEGTVEYIGWRVCRIRTFDKRPLYVPNSAFLSISVENPSRMENRRIKTLIGVRYSDANKISVITDRIETMLREHQDIDQTRTTFVKLVNFAPSSLEILVYTFTKTTDWVTFQGVQQDVFLKIIEIIEACGGECAFPTRTVHMVEEA